MDYTKVKELFADIKHMVMKKATVLSSDEGEVRDFSIRDKSGSSISEEVLADNAVLLVMRRGEARRGLRSVNTAGKGSASKRQSLVLLCCIMPFW